MEAVRRSEARVQDGRGPGGAQRFVPALPTLWPHMLLGRYGTAGVFPFEAPGVRYFYFARNAVWTLSRILGLERGEVLLPAYHHGVEIEALVDAGATPRYYRVNWRMEVDPDDVKRLITPRTRAIYLIHYAGFPGPARALKELAQAHGIPLIEDCALSLLSHDGERPLGSIGDASIFCLYKTLPVPNGGALVMNGERPRGIPAPPEPPVASTLSHLASALLMNLELRGGLAGRLLRQTVRAVGRTAANGAGLERVATGTQHFDRAHVHLGMSRLSRRIALTQNFPLIVEKRRRNYFYLLGQLRDLAPPVRNQLPPGACPLFFPIRVEEKQKVMRRLAARGIETIDFWSVGHPSCPAGEFPEVDTLRRSILEIPCHQDLDQPAMAMVARAVREAVRETA